MTEKVSVVINFTPDYRESGFQSVESVIQNAHLVRDLHIVHAGYNGNELYSGWSAQHARLKTMGLEPTWHPVTLDISKLQTRVLVYIEPDLYVTESAFMMLLEDVASPRIIFAKQRLAVSSVLNIRAEGSDFIRETISEFVQFMITATCGLFACVFILAIFKMFAAP